VGYFLAKTSELSRKEHTQQNTF